MAAIYLSAGLAFVGLAASLPPPEPPRRAMTSAGRRGRLPNGHLRPPPTRGVTPYRQAERPESSQSLGVPHLSYPPPRPGRGGP